MAQDNWLGQERSKGAEEMELARELSIAGHSWSLEHTVMWIQKRRETMHGDPQSLTRAFRLVSSSYVSLNVCASPKCLGVGGYQCCSQSKYILLCPANSQPARSESSTSRPAVCSAHVRCLQCACPLFVGCVSAVTLPLRLLSSSLVDRRCI